MQRMKCYVNSHDHFQNIAPVLFYLCFFVSNLDFFWFLSSISLLYFIDCFRWEGSAVNEVGKDKNTGVVRVKVNPKYYRPTEVVSKVAKLIDISVLFI